MKAKNKTVSNRIIRHLRLRKRVKGTVERPRLSVHPSLKHIEAQIVDDFDQKTLLGLSTKAKEFRKLFGKHVAGNVKAAATFGEFVAAKAKEKGISRVVFDRSGFLYHGRIKAFAEAARAKGLQF